MKIGSSRFIGYVLYESPRTHNDIYHSSTERRFRLDAKQLIHCLLFLCSLADGNLFIRPAETRLGKSLFAHLAEDASLEDVYVSLSTKLHRELYGNS